jgi:hypothetical protein
MNSTTTPWTSNGAPTGASPTAPPAVNPVGAAPPIAVRWVSRDGVRNSIACTHIDVEPCDLCSRAFAVDLLTPALDGGLPVLACGGCLERLREEALDATA